MTATAVIEPAADRAWEPISDVDVADRLFTGLDRRAREWAGVTAAATAAFVEVIAEVRARGLIEQFGFRSLEQWVSLRCGISFAHAKRMVAIATTLERLPLVREKFAAGAVSEDQLVEIAKAGVTPFHDREAAEFAAVMTVPQLRKALSFLPDVPAEASVDASPQPPAHEPASAPEPEPEPASAPEPEPASAAASEPSGVGSREFIQFGDTGHGDWELRLRLSAERGAVVEKAIDAGRDREYRDRHGAAADPNDPPTGISNLDGFWRLIGDALDIADPATRRGKPPSDRYLVNIHLHPDGNSNVHLGPRLLNATRDELCCDAEVRTWLHHPDGTVGLGRRARVVSPRLRIVVEHRDGGCVVPGCGSRWRLRVHHLTSWLDLGATNPDNLVCLCPSHHKGVHGGELIISGNPDQGTLRITDRWGRPYSVGTPIPPTDERLAAANLQATDSPWRAGEKAVWHWIDWTDPTPRRPPPPKPWPPPPREPSALDRYDFRHLDTPWAPKRRRPRRDSHDGDSDDDVTYG